MKLKVFYIAFLLLFSTTATIVYAQDDTLEVAQSAEVFLEEYTDEFQEAFFNALKQKGIQNYDRAANLLLECKKLKTNITVVDHELAKVYYLDKDYVSAKKYAIETLIGEPENYWYLDTLMAILEKQYNSIEIVKSSIPYDNEELQKNLVLIYYKKGDYPKAIKVLDKMHTSKFKEEHTAKLNYALKKQKEENTTLYKFETKTEEVSPSSTEGLKTTLKSQIKIEQFRTVENTAKNAVEEYPLQPFFYYAYGLALHKNNKNRESIKVLESSLDYLFDDISLANKIYKTLADAYTKLNNNVKANLYFNKIKPGF